MSPRIRKPAPGRIVRSWALLLPATVASPLYAQQPAPSATVPILTQPVPQTPALPDHPAIPPISHSVAEVPSTAVDTPPLVPHRSAATGLTPRLFFGPYRPATAPPLFAGNADRLRPLVRDGKLFLSARDAILLAIENNLDVEIERLNLLLADSDYRRAKGGGNLRGIDFTIEQAPNGVGGPGSPLLNTTAANPNPTTPTVTDLTSLNSTVQVPQNLSSSSTVTQQYAVGPSIPLFDPNIFLQTGYLRRSNTVTLTSLNGTSTSGTGGTGGTGGGGSTTPNGTADQTAPVSFIPLNVSYLQGFAPGTQITATVNNDSQVIYGSQSKYDPLSRPSTSITVSQPLLRGRGSAVNTRFIRISNENRKVSRLLFEQQVLETVYGVSRIYFDLVSLGENVQVKQEALRAARKLEQDDQAQVDFGTLAPVELVRAHALVSTSEFDVIQAQGLYRQQEVILRNQLLRTGSPVFAAGFTEIVPTDTISVPDTLDTPAVEDLIAEGLARRPDLAQSALQVRTGQIALSASRNQTLPQLNAYANVQTRGATEQAYEQPGTPGTGIPTLPQNFALGGLRVSTIAQAGVQLNLPLRNRVAQADVARDVVQLRETQARTEKISEQIRQDIENARIALETSFAAYRAARASRGYQEQLLSAERDKLEFGQSTPLLVLQNEAYLAQAQSTEIAARSNFQKAKIELDRSLGDLLEKNAITLEDAVEGKLKQ